MASDTVAIPPPPVAAHAPDAYAVKERVSIGTAGVVYRALHRESGREVLFKVLMEQASHPLNTAQVLAIAPALMRLKHARIAELLDAYEDPEGTVLVYPLIPGMAGSEFPLKERPLSPAEARQVARQLCEALLVGERAAFPHGDVKPSNIVINQSKEDGSISVQLQDWGLSSCRTVQPPETLQFMAPERHHGHPTSVQGDLFSLGASLWFLITGHLPAESGTREELLEEWGAFDPATLVGLQPEVDNHFRQWLAWLLRWQPRDRPPTVAKALEVLQQVISFVDATEARASSGGGAHSAASTPAPSSTAAPGAPATPPSTPLPAKPLATRPSAGGTASSTARTERLRPPPGDSGPPTSTPPPRPTPPAVVAAQSKSSAPAPARERERGSLASKLMGGVLICCVLAAVGVLFVWWAEEEWGPDWRREIVAAAKARLRTNEAQPTVATSATVSKSEAQAADKAKASTAAKATSKGTGPTAGLAANAAGQKPQSKPLSAKPASKPTKSSSSPPANYKPISAEELFKYADGMTLEGAAGGKGWKTPWKASQVVKGKSADGKYQGVLLGASQPASMSRELDPGGTFNNGSVAVALDLWHPGAGGSALELDLLGTADTASSSPILITPEGNQLKISIKGVTENIPVNAGVPLKLALKWTFKKNKDGTAEVTVDVFANPKPGTSNPTALSPKIGTVLPSYKLPTSLTFTARTTEGGSTPVVLQKMSLAKSAKDAIDAGHSAK
jgi:serine/threonine protein kinase